MTADAGVPISSVRSCACGDASSSVCCLLATLPCTQCLNQPWGGIECPTSGWITANKKFDCVKRKKSQTVPQNKDINSERFWQKIGEQVHTMVFSLTGLPTSGQCDSFGCPSELHVSRKILVLFLERVLERWWSKVSSSDLRSVPDAIPAFGKAKWEEQIWITAHLCRLLGNCRFC